MDTTSIFIGFLVGGFIFLIIGLLTGALIARRRVHVSFPHSGESDARPKLFHDGFYKETFDCDLPTVEEINVMCKAGGYSKSEFYRVAVHLLLPTFQKNPNLKPSVFQSALMGR